MFLGAAGHDVPRSEVELLEEERGCLTNLVRFRFSWLRFKHRRTRCGQLSSHQKNYNDAMTHLQGLHCFLLRLNLAGVQSVHHQLSLLRFEHKYVPCVNN